MELLLKTGGLYCALLAVFHLAFWRIFDWKEDLRSLTFLNQAIMQVLNLCLTLVFVFFAYVSLMHSTELLTTKVGRSLLVFLALFWLARAVMQAVFFKLGNWRSVAFLLYFTAGGVLYAIPATHAIWNTGS